MQAMPSIVEADRRCHHASGDAQMGRLFPDDALVSGSERNRTREPIVRILHLLTLFVILGLAGTLSAGCKASEDSAYAGEVATKPPTADDEPSVELATREPAPLKDEGPASSPSLDLEARQEEAVSLGSYELIFGGAEGLTPTLPVGVNPSAQARDVLSVTLGQAGHIVATIRPGDLMMESKDGGVTWKTWATNLRVNQAVPDGYYWWGLGDSDRLGHAQRVLRSQDKGRTWEPRVTGEKLDPEPLFLAIKGSELSLVTDKFILASKNNGKRWDWRNPHLGQLVTAYQREPRDSNHKLDAWWLGGAQGAIGHNTAKKGEWVTELLPESQNTAVRGFARATTEDGHNADLFAATDHGLWRRTDDGEVSWTLVESLGRVKYNGVAFDSKGRGVAFGDFGAIAVSVDGGASWSRETQALALRMGYPWPLALQDKLELNLRHGVLNGDHFLLFGDNFAVLRLRLP
ncbi:MAG: hypothetical protein AUK47_20595 [Deltaproteobacteria bacterium CG2_30_63_29]|nr:MAG: hypothetical protein AUK47_20595 [Deltaproteobacteria bacterium CG2_30_63_29]